jgi:hypothetical protein
LTTVISTDVAVTAAGSDPERGLRAVASLRLLTEQLESLQVDRARDLGWSWAQIAAELGVSKQAVHQKHGGRVGRTTGRR